MATRLLGACFALLLLAKPMASAGTGEDPALPSARAIVERAFENLYGFHSIQRVALRSQLSDGSDFVRTARILRRGTRGGDYNRMLIRLIGTGELRGVGLLLMERETLEYDAFLYQPSLRKVRRVSIAQRQDSFFGTDVCFEDLEGKRADQWKTRMIGPGEQDGRPTWVIELVPHDIPSGYSRIVGHFDQDLPIILRTEFFKEDGSPKTLEVELAKVLQIGEYWIPSSMTFSGASGSSTVVELSDIDIRDQLPDRYFTRSTLEYGDSDLGVGINPTNGESSGVEARVP